MSVSGCFVTVMPKVIKRPASPGKDLSTGIELSDNLLLSVSTTSVTGPWSTYLGPYSLISESLGSIFNLLSMPEGIFIFVSSVIRLPISEKSLVSSAISSRFMLPKALPSTCILEPSTFSKSTAGLSPAYIRRRMISAISKLGLTFALTRLSWSACSSASTYSPRLSRGNATAIWDMKNIPLHCFIISK